MLNKLPNEHKKNINVEIFNEIAQVFLDMEVHYYTEFEKLKECKAKNTKYSPNIVKWVCDAAPGHGKTSVLIAWLKMILENGVIGRETNSIAKKRIPVLICVREKSVAEDITEQLSMFENKVLYVTSENKDDVMDDVNKTQVVIITHQRLKNLALGYGKIDNWKIWQNLIGKYSYKRNRICIIDEMPDFVDSSIWNIDNKNNCLDWFDRLSNGIEDIDSKSAQKIKSFVMSLFSLQISSNETDSTVALYKTISDEYAKTSIADTNMILKKMKENQIVTPEISQRIKHLERLFVEDEFGKIDDYKGNGKGRQIITSSFIYYGNLGMNMLVLDGTAGIQWDWYQKAGFGLKHIQNRNDYTRLFINQEEINTSLYCRTNKDYSVQKAISENILRYRKILPDMFVLPCKSDIDVYKSLNCINPEHELVFELNVDDNQLPLNLMNTTGKNLLKNVKEMYITSLPRMHADFYKAKALALYGYDICLEINDEKNSIDWFVDERVENLYKSYLHTELIQIIHRTKLRIIDSKDKIIIFIAYSDNQQETLIDRLKNDYFLCCNNSNIKVINDEDYNRKRNMDRSINCIIKHLNNDNLKTPISLYSIGLDSDKSGKKLSNLLSKRNNYESRSQYINEQLKKYGYELYIYKGTKKIKFFLEDDDDGEEDIDALL